MSSIIVRLYPGEEGQAPEGEAIAETTTDAEGRFEFGGLQSGLYLVAVGVDVPDIGACRVAHLFTVKEGTVANADVALPSMFPQIGPGQVGLLITGDLIAC